MLRISGANAYVQLVCWVFIRSLLPYAAAHAMGSNSSTAAAHEAHVTGSAGELQGYAVTQRARSAPACSPLGAHAASQPPPQRPSRERAAARWAREESPRRVDAGEGLRRRSGACPKSPMSPPSTTPGGGVSARRLCRQASSRSNPPLSYLQPGAHRPQTCACSRARLSLPPQPGYLAITPAGALASAFLPNRALRLGPTYCAMLLPLTLLTAMALGWPLGSQAAAATLLLVAVVVARGTDGLVSPLLYRVAGDPYPETERQAVTQWVGIVAILAAAVGSSGALCLVLTGAIE